MLSGPEMPTEVADQSSQDEEKEPLRGKQKPKQEERKVTVVDLTQRHPHSRLLDLPQQALEPEPKKEERKVAVVNLTHSRPALVPKTKPAAEPKKEERKVTVVDLTHRQKPKSPKKEPEKASIVDMSKRPAADEEKKKEEEKKTVPTLEELATRRKAREENTRLRKMHATICEGFEVALSPDDIPKRAEKEKYTMMDDLVNERKNSGSPFVLLKSDAEMLLETKLLLLNGEGLLNYLCDAYNRVRGNSYSIPQSDVDELLECLRGKAVRTIFEAETYYGEESIKLHPALGVAQPIRDFMEMLRSQGSAAGRFFAETVVKLRGMEKGRMAMEALVIAIYKLCVKELSGLKPEDEYGKWSGVVGVVQSLIQNREAAQVFMQLELSSLNVYTSLIEYTSVLGNLLRYSYLPQNSKYAMGYFRDNNVASFGKVESLRRSREALTTSVQLMQDRAKNVIAKLYVEHGLPEVLSWFLAVANKNADRAKMMHGNEVSSSGFIMNALQMLLVLCNGYTKDYENYVELAGKVKGAFCDAGVLDYHTCDRINKASVAGQQEEERKEGFNDLTKTFFLTHYYMNLCFGEIREHVEQMWRRYEKDKSDDVLHLIFSFYVHTFSPQFMTSLADFLAFTMFVLMADVKPPVTGSVQDYLKSGFCFPFSPDISKSLAILPDHVLNNVHEAFEFYINNPEDDFFKCNGMFLNLITKLYVALLAMPYMSNLHKRASLTDFFGRLVDERKQKFSRGIAPFRSTE